MLYNDTTSSQPLYHLDLLLGTHSTVYHICLSELDPQTSRHLLQDPIESTETSDAVANPNPSRASHPGFCVKVVPAEMAVLPPHDVHHEIRLLRSLTHPNVSPSALPRDFSHSFTPVRLEVSTRADQKDVPHPHHSGQTVAIPAPSDIDHPAVTSYVRPGEDGMGAVFPISSMDYR